MNARAWFVGVDGRLHAPWRLLLFIVVALICTTIVSIAFRLLFSLVPALNVGLSGDPIALGGLQLVVSLLIAHAIMLRIDHRAWSAVSLHREAARPGVLARGWLLGAATIAVPSLIMLATGMLAIRRTPDGSWWAAAIIVSLGLLPAALWEELLSRGYLFATLREWLGWPVATLASSVAFGLMHLTNPGADVQSVIMVILAGAFLALVLVVTNSLYAAWMAHWAWNWIMAVPLHVAVSGLPLSRPDYEIVDAGPDWLTGGGWGPEGGAGAGLSMIVAVTWLYARRRRAIATALPNENNG